MSRPRSTRSLIAENARYVRATGFDRPLIVAELRRRAAAGDSEAAAAFGGAA